MTHKIKNKQLIISSAFDINNQRMTNVDTPIDGFDAVNKDFIDYTAGGSWFLNTIKTDYYWLVKLFGMPIEKDWEGNNYVWVLQNEHGRLVSIYDNNSGYDEDEIKDIDFYWRIRGRVPSDADDLIAYIYNKTI